LIYLDTKVYIYFLYRIHNLTRREFRYNIVIIRGKTMQQKVIQVGNSLAVTLPSEFVKSKNIEAGQPIFVDANAQLDLIEIRTKISDKLHLTTEFKEWLDKVSEKYKDAIKELATK